MRRAELVKQRDYRRLEQGERMRWSRGIKMRLEDEMMRKLGERKLIQREWTQ